MSGATQFFLSVNANSQVIVTLFNNATPPVPATLSGDQVFIITPAFGGMTSVAQTTPISPLNLTIPAGQTQAIASYVQTSSAYQTAAVTQVAVAVGAGPLFASELPNQNCLLSLDPDDVTTTSMCVNGLTRPIMRDEIRRMISKTPPTDNIYGAVMGETPTGDPWPSNTVLNQVISQAIQTINRRCRFYNQNTLTIPVTATQTIGPQWLNLQGVAGQSLQNVINQILRISWDDGSGNPYVLQPQNWRSDDKQQWYRFNNLSPSVPQWYIMESYQIGLLPACSQNGTLDVWAGTGIVNFCSDTDPLNQLPIDYQPIIEYVAVTLLCAMNPSRQDAKEQMAMYGDLADKGIDEIIKWSSNMAGLLQNDLTFRSRRVIRYV